MSESEVESPSTVRSFKLRTGRLGPLAEAAHARQWPIVGFEIPRNHTGERFQPLDLASFFGSTFPVVMEIGFGMGIATASMAEDDPDRGLLAVDVHTPGIAALCRQIEDRSLHNIRIAHGDVMDLLRDHMPAEALSGVRIFFPDPWPKKRHHKRRLISKGFLDLIAAALQPGSLVHFATDWDSYAEHAAAVFDDHPAFTPIDAVPARPTTAYERAGLRAGRASRDLAYERL